MAIGPFWPVTAGSWAGGEAGIPSPAHPPSRERLLQRPRLLCGLRSLGSGVLAFESSSCIAALGCQLPCPPAAGPQAASPPGAFPAFLTPVKPTPHIKFPVARIPFSSLALSSPARSPFRFHPLNTESSPAGLLGRTAPSGSGREPRPPKRCRSSREPRIPVEFLLSPCLQPTVPLGSSPARRPADLTAPSPGSSPLTSCPMAGGGGP